MKNDKIKLLALDLDGTTLTSGNYLSDRVSTSLKKAINSGVEVIAASGRPYHSMPEKILDFDGINYFITSNGAAVYDKSGNRLFREMLSEKAVLDFLKVTENYDLVFDMVIDGATNSDARYLNDPAKYGCPEAYLDYIKYSKSAVKDGRRFMYENRKRMDGFQIVSADFKLLSDVKNLVSKTVDDIFITSSADNFAEFSSPKATKAQALEFMCKRLNVEVSACAACGNADNDVNMIEFAGLGAAVKNASPDCINVASLVVAANDNDGVSELIDYILNFNNI